MFFRRLRGCHGDRQARGSFGHDHGHRFGGGRGRFGRMFDHGDLRLVILHLIAEKPRHGYEVIKAIEEKTGGAYSPSPGVVYPTLTLLEELGHVTVQPGEGTRKLYAITPEGEAFLQANQAAADAIAEKFAAISAAQAGPTPQVERAAQNLRLALRMRLSRGKVSEEQLRRIAAVLDAAATEIERE